MNVKNKILSIAGILLLVIILILLWQKSLLVPAFSFSNLASWILFFWLLLAIVFFLAFLGWLFKIKILSLLSAANLGWLGIVYFALSLFLITNIFYPLIPFQTSTSPAIPVSDSGKPSIKIIEIVDPPQKVKTFCDTVSWTAKVKNIGKADLSFANLGKKYEFRIELRLSSNVIHGGPSLKVKNFGKIAPGQEKTIHFSVEAEKLRDFVDWKGHYYRDLPVDNIVTDISAVKDYQKDYQFIKSEDVFPVTRKLEINLHYLPEGSGFQTCGELEITFDVLALAIIKRGPGQGETSVVIKPCR